MSFRQGKPDVLAVQFAIDNAPARPLKALNERSLTGCGYSNILFPQEVIVRRLLS